MISIIKANETHAPVLYEIGKLSFLESHGHSAHPKDINAYVAKTYSIDILKKELEDPGNIYHILYYDNQPAGYSKIIFNSPYANSEIKDITKLERIYLLKEFYGLDLGSKLFKFNLNLAKENDQKGLWLFVWKENQRAVGFYKKMGFTIIGSYDFWISEDHFNPNHQMFLGF